HCSPPRQGGRDQRLARAPRPRRRPRAPGGRTGAPDCGQHRHPLPLEPRSPGARVGRCAARLAHAGGRTQHPASRRVARMDARPAGGGRVSLALQRRAFWLLLAAKLAGGWGVGWDIRWHMLIGRDSFWIPPHVLTYASVVAVSLLSLGVLLAGTRNTRSLGHLPEGAIRVAGLVGSRGLHLAGWGMAVTILAAPIDDLWHRLFGIDVTLWSPPHLLGLAGAQISTLGCLLIALEVYAPGSGGQRAALLAAGSTLVSGFIIALTPG